MMSHEDATNSRPPNSTPHAVVGQRALRPHQQGAFDEAIDYLGDHSA